MKTNLNKTNSWQASLVNAVTDPKELLELLELDMSLLSAARHAATLFPLKIPRGFLSRIKKRDLTDPLLRQILPLAAEHVESEGYVKDGLQEARFNPIPGLLHKYPGRVLLTLSGACAINCRFCFRRHFPYEDNNPGRSGWDAAINYIANNPIISEVILSGGDPLVVSDNLLRNLLTKLSAIPHITRLRIHSRMPIVLPERITQELLTLFNESTLKIIVVVHANHAQEISPEVRLAMQQLKTANVTLLNQSVLLKGVNDSVEALVDLSECLFNAGILPYYLHVLDKVQGTAHFDLDWKHARQLHWEMSQQLSGYLVPKLVTEQPGAPAKVLLNFSELYTD